MILNLPTKERVMKFSHLLIVLFAAFSLGLAACSSEEESSSVTTTSLVSSPMAGTWVKSAGACLGEGGTDNLGNPSYYKSALVITDTTIANQWTQYNDTTCANQVRLDDLSGTIDVYTDTTFTLSWTTLTKTYTDADYVADANSNNVCGGGWTLDLARDVSDCADFADSGVGVSQTVTFEISADGTTMTVGTDIWTKQ